MPQLPAAPSWGPWAGAGEREPPQNATGLPAVCLCLRMASRHTRAPRWGRDGGGPCSHTEGLASLSPPQSFCPFSGPGATPTCRCNFPGALGAALPLRFPAHGWLRPPPGPPSAGVGQAPRFPPLYEAPLQQAHYNFCRKHSASLSCLCLGLLMWGVGDGGGEEGGGGRGSFCVYEDLVLFLGEERGS